MKDKDEFIKFYQENLMIIQMIEFCEVVNPESISSKIISVDSAADFFGFISNGVEDDNLFIKDLNKSRDIIDDSFTDPPEAAFI